MTAFRARSLSPNRPHAVGMTQNPDVFFQLREAVNPYYEALPGIVEGYMNAINTLTGSDEIAPFGGVAFHDTKVWLRKL